MGIVWVCPLQKENLYAYRPRNLKLKGETVKQIWYRRVHESNVENRNNGDVVIMNIPMVDQGPKGYCTPLTLWAYEIPADVSACRWKHGMGGGTVNSTLLTPATGGEAVTEH